MQICAHDAAELLNSHDQELIRDDLVEVEAEPKDRTVVVLKGTTKCWRMSIEMSGKQQL
jgi:hypothetical protein